MENRKFYSFFNTNRCIGTNGEYVGVTTIATLVNIQKKDVNGKSLVSARASISNQANAINKALNTNIQPDENGNIWIDVLFWESTADRFMRYLGDRDRTKVVLVGTMNSRTYQKNDGTETVTASITATNWSGLDTKAN